MWINVNGPLPDGGTGSTEHMTAGLGTAGNRVQWTGTGSTADGYWFAADGDGGAVDTSTTSGDFCAYVGTSLRDPTTGVYSAGTNSTARGNSDPYYLAAFPTGLSAPAVQQANYSQQTGALASGTLGLAWHEMIVARRGSTVDWAIDGIRLATLTNATFTASNIFVGYWDSYASLSDNTNLSFGLVDNLRVELPATMPAITVQPRSQTNLAGTCVTLSVTATGTAPLAYRWQRPGTTYPAGTNTFLACETGNYSVVVSNLVGMVTSAVATVTFTNLPPALPGHLDSICRAADGTIKLTMTGTACTNYILQASGDLVGWSNLCTLSGSNGLFWWVDPGATNGGQRFYRPRLAP
jgi:hypothetical protein